jgi:hypothetical protein
MNPTVLCDEPPTQTKIPSCPVPPTSAYSGSLIEYEAILAARSAQPDDGESPWV